MWPVANLNFSEVIFLLDFGRAFGKRFQANLIDQAQVKYFQVMGKNISAVGARLQPVARKIGTCRTKLQFIFFHAFPCVANAWFYGAIPFNCAAAGAGEFLFGDSHLKKMFEKVFVVFAEV